MPCVYLLLSLWDEWDEEIFIKLHQRLYADLCDTLVDFSTVFILSIRYSAYQLTLIQL